MSTKVNVDDLKGPDAFVTSSDHVFAFVEKHSKTFLAVVIVGLVVALAYVGYNYFSSNREIKASEAIFKPEAELRKAQSQVREERAKKMQELAAGQKTKGDAAEMVRPSDFAKDYASAVDKVKAAIQAHSDTRSALVAALNLSYFLLEQKQAKEAQDVLNLVKFDPKSDDLLNGFWLMHRGLIFSENAEPDKAIGAYEAVIKSANLKAFYPEALLKLGVVYQSKGDVAKARETYERLGREFPEGEATTSSKQYLRLLEIKSAKQG